MKRIGNLFDRVISIENLQLADQKARKGKLRSYGVQMHDKNRDANILALHESLKTERSERPNIISSPYTSRKKGKFTVCPIIPTVSCTMPL